MAESRYQEGALQTYPSLLSKLPRSAETEYNMFTHGVETTGPETRQHYAVLNQTLLHSCLDFPLIR